MDLEDEDNDLVKEMDVYLTNSCSLYLLQYPTFSKKFNADQRSTARVKPQHKKMEMDVLLDVSSPNYDQGKGEQIAINVDGGASGDGITFENSVMDYQTLTSHSVPQTGHRFAAGSIRDGKLFITPITHVMQMQPGFKYMDHAEKRAMQAAKMKAQTESGHSSQDEAEDAKAVTIRFKGAETEASRALREKSYAAYEKRLYQEKWISATVHHKDDLYSERERKRLFSKQPFNAIDDDNYSEMEISTDTYLKTMVPHYVVSDVDSETSPENVLSLTKLKQLPLGEQLKLLMKSAKIMHFSHLHSMLPSNSDVNSVVRSLQSYAVLVNGCWIVKSDVLYPPNTVSPISGTSSDIMCKVRDYILCLFTKHEFLIRREVTKQVNISGEEVKNILEQIAKMKVGSGWHLKLPRDKSFIHKFPDVEERQAMVWSTRFKQLSKRFTQENESTEQPTKATNSTSKLKTTAKAVKTSPTAKRKRKVSQSKVKTEISEKELNGLKTFLSPPRPTNEDSNVIVDHAVADITDHSAVDVAQPFAIPLRAEDSSKSSTELLHDVDPPLNNGPVAPFVNPATLSDKDTFAGPLLNLTELNPVFSADCKIEVDKPSLCPSDGINMDNVNATVALVANQMMRQQAVTQNNVFNSSESSQQ